MRRMIELAELDALLKTYSRRKRKGETFSEFVESTEAHGWPIWDWVHPVGIVMPSDIDAVFPKEFVKKRFDDLADCWFKGLREQVDFGILVDCVHEQFKDELKAGDQDE